MFSSFSYELKKLLNDSKKEMKKLKHSYIGTEHFFLSILKSKNNFNKLLNKYNITYETFKKKIIDKVGIGNDNNNLFILTPLFKKILEDSILLSNDMKREFVDLEIVIKSIIEEGEGVAYRVICDMGVDVDSLYDSISVNAKKMFSSSLSLLGVDLTENAKNGLIDPVVGREKEIENLIKILLRKNKKNALLIGPAGVGKTAIVEKLARLIIDEDVPKGLLNKRIISISIASLVAGTKYRGEFEEKLLDIIKDVENDNNIILFIDEIHTIMKAGGAEGAVDASNILKPALSRDKITIIGATTDIEYRKYIEDDKAFSRRFQKVVVNEPNEEELFIILKKVKESYENHHNVIIDNKVLKYIINISKKYINNRKEPDRSIDIIDEVSSFISTRMNNEELSTKLLKDKLNKIKNIKNDLIKKKSFDEALQIRKKERKLESYINNKEMKCDKIPKQITINDVNLYISNRYNMPFYKCNGTKSVLKKHKSELKEKCIVYNKEIDELIESIEKIFKVDIKIDRPISLLFSGNDKNIKNEIINYLSKRLFNNFIINIDLSEYSFEHSIYKIIGSLSYDNKQHLFESLKEQPFNLIVFNNFDKAHIKIKELIKEILTKGYFIDSNGYKIDFLNSLIIFNSNESNYLPIGFNNNCVTFNNSLSKYIFKIINFNKIKASVI